MFCITLNSFCIMISFRKFIINVIMSIIAFFLVVYVILFICAFLTNMF